MLNLPVAMVWFLDLILIFASLGLPFFSNTPQIDTPRPGDVLKGLVLIQGSTDIPGFQHAEISFTYEQNPVDWFLIAQNDVPKNLETLAVWDTTLIPDGDYRLRVLVYLDDGSMVETTVERLKVRNYTPLETIEGNIQENHSTPTVLSLIPNEPASTPTDLPGNPVEISKNQIRSSQRMGIGVALGIAVLLIIYGFLIRRKT